MSRKTLAVIVFSLAAIVSLLLGVKEGVGSGRPEVMLLAASCAVDPNGGN